MTIGEDRLTRACIISFIFFSFKFIKPGSCTYKPFIVNYKYSHSLLVKGAFISFFDGGNDKFAKLVLVNLFI